MIRIRSNTIGPTKCDCICIINHNWLEQKTSLEAGSHLTSRETTYLLWKSFLGSAFTDPPDASQHIAARRYVQHVTCPVHTARNVLHTFPFLAGPPLMENQKKIVSPGCESALGGPGSKNRNSNKTLALTLVL